jgi:hypothetical protein
MKFKIFIAATLICFASFPCKATDQPSLGTAIVDLLLMRPAGLIATVTGAALFTGLTPLTALADIPPPHDAFEILAKPVVYAPFAFTFQRPLGVVHPDSDGVYRRR